MNLTELLQRRVIFVSGKGGVGKTSISIMLALLAARKQKKTLLVEMNSTGRVPPIFEVPSTGFEEIPLLPYITTINLSPRNCFKEYVMRLLFFTRLYKTFFENKYVNNFLNAAPGLDEFLMFNKITSLEDEFSNQFVSRLKYDLIIIDAPATGHGLSALEVPGFLASGVKIGPLNKQANRILDLLDDRRKTAFCLVTLAEEMPVCESEDYIKALKERTGLGFGPIFVNAIMPQVEAVSVSDSLPANLQIFQNYYNLAKERAQLNQEYLEEINKRFPDFEKIIIPFQFQGLHTSMDFKPLIEDFAAAAGSAKLLFLRPWALDLLCKAIKPLS